MNDISIGSLDDLCEAVDKAESLKRRRRDLMDSLTGDRQTDPTILAEIDQIEEQLDHLGIE